MNTLRVTGIGLTITISVMLALLSGCSLYGSGQPTAAIPTRPALGSPTTGLPASPASGQLTPVLPTLLAPAATKLATAVAALKGIPAFDHIFIVVEENHSYNQIIGSASAPYINSLAAKYGLATHFTAETHPSLPNYLAMIGGDTFGITSDCTKCFVNAPNLIDRVEASGRSWKGYMESMPVPCTIGDAGTRYAQKHNPFIYFDDIGTNPTRCNKIVPYSELAADLTIKATTPNFVWITPNLCDDMHNCTVSTGDSWLRNNLPTILYSPAWTSQRSLLVITWDEGFGSSNQIPTLIIDPSAKPAYKSAVPYTHYSLLRTIEDSWGLQPLTKNDTSAVPMSDFWR